MAKTLITGGLGFIGSNLAYRLLNNGHEVIIIDNMSRIGCHHNLNWLKNATNTGMMKVFKASINDEQALRQAMSGCNHIFHLAGQVSVVDSLIDPMKDFEDNALGTLRVLECAKAVTNNPIIVFSSTNKVYGSLNTLNIGETASSYYLKDYPHGVSETHALDFHSPYGCSKGASDLYVLDYSRTFNLRTVVLRQSCIYGGRQYGMEEQGWISWFIIAALFNRNIRIYGNGKQVRDVLYIEDLIDAYVAVIDNIDTCSGHTYNIGGGPENTISIWIEFREILEKLIGKKLNVEYHEPRVGDQKIYVSDIRKAFRDFGWQPRFNLEKGIGRTFGWIEGHIHLLQEIYKNEVRP